MPMSLAQLLQDRAASHGDQRAFTFLRDGERDAIHLTFAELDERARAVAGLLEQSGARGRSVLLVYPAGLDFIAALFGCFHAGAIAVTVKSPRSRRPAESLGPIVADSRAELALTTRESLDTVRAAINGVLPSADTLRWLTTDDAAAAACDTPPPDTDSLAMLQYTSGSTRLPRGVMLSHGNVLANIAMIRGSLRDAPHERFVSWLPHYHDMGLISGLLFPISVGGHVTFMSPSDFLQRPSRWLQAISDSGAHVSAAPNSAYELCATRIDASQREALDLSDWRTAVVGAEPIRHSTIERFIETFAPCGFRRTAFCPSYGLAEATVFVAGGHLDRRASSRSFSRAGLRDGIVLRGADPSETLVSCGPAALGVSLRIVDPESGNDCPPHRIGEIWVAGPNVAQGYWDKPHETRSNFQAKRTAAAGESFLRTGDMGFISEGELFITGRRKELIIVRGQNHAPHDIEATVAEAHPALHSTLGAAFSLDTPWGEGLVIAHELLREQRQVDPTLVFEAVRRAIAERHELSVHSIVLLRPGGLPLTTSGKVQRQRCRELFLKNGLAAMAQWTDDDSGHERDTGLVGMEDARQDVREWLLRAIAKRTRTPWEQVDASVPFAHHGLDSAAVAELAGELERMLGRRLSPTLLYEYPTIDQFASYLGGTAADIETVRWPSEVQFTTAEPIAIVGIGCRFPGAANPDAYWNLLHQGVDAIRRPPQRPWVDHPPDPGDGSSVPLWGGYVDNVDLFDARFFGIAPREAIWMDPQQRLLLEVTWEAIQDARQEPTDLRGSSTGVFVGISTNDYGRLALGGAHACDLHTNTGNALSIAANRLSYQFDLRGPSLAIDTACSASLVAVHLACESLRTGQCDLALAGGVNLILSWSITAAFAQARFLAPDGRCKPFDAQANGYVRGEGAGMVVLKPLSRAIKDGNAVYAVLLGSAVNQDGRSNGLTAPNPQSQRAVLLSAYHRAGVSPGDVQYVEAHGTGTALGDPIEARVLGEVLGQDRRSGSCAIGSVKSNIGHLEAAAGIAGLIKVALMLSRRELPPSLHFETPNPLIPFDELPLHVQQTLAPWPETQVALAGVSSFGFGGTNAHVVLSSPPPNHTAAPRIPDVNWDRRRYWITREGEEVSPAPVLEHHESPVVLPASDVDVLIAATAEERGGLAEQYVHRLVASSLEQDSSEIDIDQPLNELGIDSLMSMEIADTVHRELQFALPFDELLAGASIRDLSRRLAQHLAEQATEKDSATAIDPAPSRDSTRATEVPLGFSQERLWLLDQLAGDVPVLNIPAAVHIEGSLDIRALEVAIDEVMRRHEALRTVIRSHEDRRFQVVQPHRPVALHVLRLSSPADQIRDEAQRLLDEEARRPLDAERGPLLRPMLLQLSDNEHCLLLTVSHLICDGWSLRVLMEELADVYSALAQDCPSPLETAPRQFSTYVREQHHALSQARRDQLAAYWRTQLGGELPVLNLPFDRPRPPVQTYRGARRYFALSPSLVQALLSLCQETGVTPFMTILAGLQALLHRYTAQDDVIVGTASAGRNGPQQARVVGPLLNPLVLRTDLSGGPTFRELLDRTRATALAAYAHQDLPFEVLLDTLHTHIDPSYPPIFQILLDLQETPRAIDGFPGMNVTRQQVDPGTAMLDLSLYLSKGPDGIEGFFEYNTDLFDASTIDRMLGHFQTLLSAAVRDPSQSILDLPLLGEGERQLVLVDWNRTAKAYDRAACVHDLFEQQVSRSPDALALQFRDQSLTYHELNERAEQLADRLRRLGVGPGRLVALCVRRSLEMMVGLWAVLKAGGAYVPIDPNYPAERRALILEDSRARIVLTERALAAGFSSEHVTLCLDEAAADNIPPVAEHPTTARATSDDLAYVLYTSGSTGRPKGVMVTHRNVVNFFEGIDELRGESAAPGVWLAVTTISFDISVLELLWTLCRGFRVVIDPGQPDSSGACEMPAAAASKPAMMRPAAVQFSLFYFECDEQQTQGDKYRLVIDGSKFADEHGFTAAWTPERHFHPFGGLYPNPAVIGAAVASVTKRLRIRAGSVVLPLQDPLRVAEEWSVVDNLSGGRVDLSFASGSHPNDFVLAPDAYDDRKAGMLREIETVQRLWRGESIRRVGGSGDEVEVRVFPRPVQTELRTWLTAIGLESFRIAGQRGYCVLTHLLFHEVEDLKEKIAAYRAAWQAARHPGEGHMTLMVHTYVGKDMNEVRQRVRQPLCDYLRGSADLFVKMGLAHDLKVNPADFTADDLNAFVEHAFERFFDFNALLGTPESCLQMIEVLRKIGVDEVACLIDFGLSRADVMEGLKNLNIVRMVHRQDRSASVDSGHEDDSLAARILRHQITHLQCTPSMARMLLTEPRGEEALAALDKLYVGGDALPPDLAARLLEHVGGELRNMYGPTETTVWSATHLVRTASTNVPIGRPVANTRVLVLDARLRPVPVGVPGELFIGGDGVAAGYHEQDQLTRERFVPDSCGESSSDRMYRTGDLVRWLPDGTLQFLGRLDNQVKIRGHRVELGEIEAALERQPSVRQSVVVPHLDASGEKHLVAFLVGSELPAHVLREELGRRLPLYAVPSIFRWLDDFPRTPNGKIDRRALASSSRFESPRQSTREERPSTNEALARLQPRADFVAPRSPVERSLALLWRGILELDEPVSVHDGFFQLGGHSLQAAIVVSRLREMYAVDLSLREFFSARDLAALGETIEGKLVAEHHRSSV